MSFADNKHNAYDTLSPPIEHSAVSIMRNCVINSSQRHMQ